jgi:DNA modification methylase
MTTSRDPLPPLTSLSDLQLDPKNANKGTPRGTEMLGESLKAYGAGRSVLVDQHGTIIAGNKTVEQAKALGLGIQVVDAAGDKLVVVRRTNLDLATDPDARALALADNRVGEVNLDWDPALVEQLAAEGVNLEPLWSPQERERLFGHGLFEGESEDDEVLEPPAETTIARGDLFALGDHRLLCGDATDAGDVSRLLAGDTPVMMATDPPYGVSYDPEWRVRAGGQGPHATGAVPNDDRVDWTDAFRLFPGHVVYVWHAGLHADAVAEGLRQCQFELRAQIIWAKPNFVLGRGDFHWQHEPCWYAVRAGHASRWCGDRTLSTVWSIPNLNPFSGGHDTENPVTGHSTQKPVALFERAYLCNSVIGECVYDPFVGSGSSIIAAQKTGRRALGIDIEPRYVQATITRWQTYTGLTATRLETSDVSTTE